MSSSFLKPASGSAGYLKAAFFGFGGSGKTFTAAELAIETRAFFELDGPIAMFDTEHGSDYIARRVRQATGRDLMVYKSKALDDLIGMAEECQRAGVSVFIPDSLSAVWREVVDSFMAEVNAALFAKKKRPYEKPEFHHWKPIKDRWQRWTDWYLNSPMHVIACGRAGYEYDFEQDDRGKKELVKTGVKMRAEGEFGYEPSLLVWMERDQIAGPDGMFEIVRTAHVMKDRFDLIDGRSCSFGNGRKQVSVFDFFRPHIEQLRPEAHQPIDTEARTRFGVDAGGDDEWARERRQRDIVCEEIKGEFQSAVPGQGAADKQRRSDLMLECFGTRSWTQLEKQTSSGALRVGLQRLRVALGTAAPAIQAVEEPMPAWAEVEDAAAASTSEGEE
jgi:hypothetical protein